MEVDTSITSVDVVHPELYSKCRLCIKEVGQIRTLPAVQEKIKFCFDIMVMPNDYLPQLLCIKCNSILANYCELKKKYLENQKILQQKLNPLKEFSEPKAAESTESAIQITPNVETTELEHKEPCLLTPKVTESFVQIIQAQKEFIENDTENLEATKPPESAKDRSGSSNSNGSNEKLKKSNKNKGRRKKLRLQSDSEEEVFTTTTTRSKNNEVSWKSIYRKKFVCRFCGKNFPTKRSFNIHLGSHSNLIEKYDAVIKQHCVVKLNKIDSIPNITGSLKNVAVLNDTIIRDTGNSTYYHSFVMENENISDEDESLGIEQKRQKRKRMRLDSDTSTESKQSKKHKKNPEPSKPSIEEDNDIQCINIDDTSSDTFDSSSAPAKTGQEYDLGVINSIVNTYYNKYKKDKAAKREDNDVLLCRKLLSTGRKIMSGHGIQAPGLVKYLEQRNLPISWYPINTQIYQGMKTNYVRIITKTREKTVHNLLSGWNVVKVNEDLIYDEDAVHMSAELTINPVTTMDSLLTKLLNANPVPNPKQLPKKINTDLQSALVAPPRKPVTQVKSSDEIYIDLDDDNDNMLMPVIMSTESLASQSKPLQITETVSLKNKENNKNKTNAHGTSNSEKDRPFPRIKCKPVSELMPQTSHNFNNVINSNVPLVVTQPVITINPPLITLTPQTASVSQYHNTMTPIIEKTILHSMLTPNSISVISQQVNGINQQDNALVGTADPGPGLSTATIKLPNSVIQSNGAAPALADAGQPVTKQLPPWSRGTLVPVVPAANENQPLVVVKEEKVQPSTSLTQTASTPVPPKPTPSNLDSKNPLNQPATPDSGEVIMNSVYLPNMPTTKPIRYFKNVLIMHDLILIIEPNTVLAEGFVCLVKFKLDVKQHARNVILGLSLFAKQNQFCIKVRKPNQEEMEIESLAAFWQMEILKSFHGQVSEKIVNSAIKISPALHDNAKQFVSLLKTIELKNCNVDK